MAQERLEVRFSPSNAEENAIIQALESLTEYGAKGRFLKARLLRGYVFMMREMESIKAENDSLAALDRVAQSMDSGTYYALRAMLYAPAAEPAPVAGGQIVSVSEQAPVASRAAPVIGHAVQIVPAASPAALPEVAILSAQVSPVEAAEPVAVASEPVPHESVVPARIEIAAAEAQPAVEPVAEEVVAEAAPEPAEVVAVEGSGDVERAAEAVSASAPAPSHNWSRFATIAGTRGGS